MREIAPTLSDRCGDRLKVFGSITGRSRRLRSVCAVSSSAEKWVHGQFPQRHPDLTGVLGLPEALLIG